MTSIRKGKSALRGIKNAVNHSHEASGREVAQQGAIQFCEDFTGTRRTFGDCTEYTAGCRHQQRRGNAFTCNISKHQPPFSVWELKIVVPIASHGAGWKGCASDRELGQQQGRVGEKL